MRLAVLIIEWRLGAPAVPAALQMHDVHVSRTHLLSSSFTSNRHTSPSYATLRLVSSATRQYNTISSLDSRQILYKAWSDTYLISERGRTPGQPNPYLTARSMHISVINYCWCFSLKQFVKCIIQSSIDLKIKMKLKWFSMTEICTLKLGMGLAGQGF